MSPARSGARPRLDPAVVRRFRRRRITDALAGQVQARGYRRTSVADIVKAAGIARNTFYQTFPSKDAAFLALLDECILEARDLVEAACGQGERDPRARRHAGLGSLLGWMTDNRARAQAVLIASYTGGEEVVVAKAAAETTFAELLGATFEGGEPPAYLAQLLVGGIATVLTRILVEDPEADLTSRGEDLGAVLDLADLWTSAGPR